MSESLETSNQVAIKYAEKVLQVKLKNKQPDNLEVVQSISLVARNSMSGQRSSVSDIFTEVGAR